MVARFLSLLMSQGLKKKVVVFMDGQKKGNKFMEISREKEESEKV